jgi:uncharacterized protein (DUF1800 family)
MTKPTPSTLRCLLWLLTAWIALPLPAVALSPDETRHLLDRTAFGANPEMLAAFAPLDRTGAVERLMAATVGTPPRPAWADDRPFPDRTLFADLPETEQIAARQDQNKQRAAQQRALQDGWMHWMLVTEDPLVERMTLFWHNHFTSQLRTVNSPQLMWRQHELLRRHALGNYADLLRAIVTDPAMLVYLDGQRNLKDRPNENFARELLELFTLGEGHYTEADVKAAARALSGWKIHSTSGTARFNPRRHDDGVKTFLGRTGPWGTDDIVAILLDQPRAADWVVEKLWIELISPQPNPTEVSRLAAVFRDNGYAIRPLLRALLTSDAFWADAHRGILIKSPIEIVVGTVRRFDLPDPNPRRLVALGTQMGQTLFEPPDVKGWPGQSAWIDTDRLLARERFLRSSTRDLADRSAGTGRAWAVLDPATATRLLWPVPDPDPAPALQPPAVPSPAEADVRVELIAAILDPRYQLK